MDRRDIIIYLAGHFDGEGSISFSKKASTGKIQHLNIQVEITFRPVLELYQQTFGGSIWHRPSRELRAPTNKPIWVWAVTTQLDIARFLLDIEPHLMEKKEKAQEAMSWVRTRLELRQ